MSSLKRGENLFFSQWEFGSLASRIIIWRVLLILTIIFKLIDGRDNLTSALNIYPESIVDPLTIDNVLYYYCSVSFPFHCREVSCNQYCTPTYMIVFIFFWICTSHVNAEFINSERPFNTLLLASGVTKKIGWLDYRNTYSQSIIPVKLTVSADRNRNLMVGILQVSVRYK